MLSWPRAGGGYSMDYLGRALRVECLIGYLDRALGGISDGLFWLPAGEVNIQWGISAAR